MLLSDLGKPTRHYLAQPPTFACDAQCCQLTNERGDALIAHMGKNAFARATTTIEHDLERMIARETMFNSGSGPWCSEMTMRHNTNQLTLLLRRGRDDRLGSSRAPLTMQHT